jgi:hypothetical protein
MELVNGKLCMWQETGCLQPEDVVHSNRNVYPYDCLILS